MIVLCSLSMELNAQQFSGPLNTTDPINRTGMVGLGTSGSMPAAQLHVKWGDVIFESLNGGKVQFTNPNAEDGMSIYSNAGGPWGTFSRRADMRYDGTTLKIGCHAASGAVGTNNLLHMTNTGNVGIGIAAPNNKLEVSGNVYVTQRLGIGSASAAPVCALDVVQGNMIANVGRVRGLTTEALVDIASFNSGLFPPAKTGLFVNRTDTNDPTTTGAEIHGQSTGIVADAVLISTGNPTGINTQAIGGGDGTATGLYAKGAGGLNSISYGVNAEARGQDSRGAYGVRGYAWSNYAAATEVYGVYGRAVYTGTGTPAVCAGYFVGDVLRTGTDNFTSDRKLKKNIEGLGQGLESVMKLKPSSYEFRTDEYRQMSLPAGKRFGFIAQDLEQVFPQLVTNAHHPEELDAQGKVVAEAVDFKAVSYTELIPVLTKAIQEQQQEIEALKAQVNAGHTSPMSVKATDMTSDSYLGQNSPNPFTVSTEISYRLPASAKTGAIGIYDLNGKELRLFPLTAGKSGSVTIQGGDLQPGMYIYTLIVDGRPADSKKMVLTSQ